MWPCKIKHWRKTYVHAKMVRHEKDVANRSWTNKSNSFVFFFNVKLAKLFRLKINFKPKTV